METTGSRLRWARERAGFTSIAGAARKFKNKGAHAQNWADAEANRRGISPDNAKLYAKWLRVDAGWLLTGQGTPEASTIPLMGYVGAGAEVFTFGPEEIEEIPAPVGTSAGDKAFVIRGASMPPFRENGIVVVTPVEDPDALLYKLVVADLVDGRRFFKRLMPSRVPGAYTLVSLNDDFDRIEDAALTSVAKLHVYIDPS